MNAIEQGGQAHLGGFVGGQRDSHRAVVADRQPRHGAKVRLEVLHKLDALRLLAPGELAAAELQVSRHDLWKFWRKPGALTALGPT